jgi:pyruvate dehydrogenase E2 component (dihydrolipoamide acetyltransferase)
MPIEILMPALSPTMTEGKLARWLVKEGDNISAGDAIAEIETDKATMEVEAVEEGTMGRILVADGSDGIAVNHPIALLLEEGEDASALDAAAAQAPSASASPTAEAPAAAPEAPKSAPTPSPQAAAAPAAATNGSGRIFASPLARRLAGEAKLDLAKIVGSGPRGRIIKVDIERAVASGGAEAAPSAAAPQAAPAAKMPAASGPGARALADMLGMEYELESLSNMRRTIAKRLTEAKQTIPHFYLTIDCQIDELLRMRKELNERFGDSVKISVNDFVIRAAALALMKVPAANASWDDEGLLRYKHADVSVAVATPGGLITPIVKAAETKGLGAISSEMRDLAGRARDGKLKPEEYQGGTFSISNLGMFGVREFAAVINPPQGCILAVGAGDKRAVVTEDGVAAAIIMTCTLSVDHRAVDGAVGAEFLAAFKKLIEYPASMLL